MNMKNFDTELFTLITKIVFAIFLIITTPLFVIWGWNILFGAIHTIEYTFVNWAAVYALKLIFISESPKNSK
jgi:hypothetical protein